MFSIHDFCKIKDHLPIIYLGHSELSAAKLILIVGKLREQTNKQLFLVLKESYAQKFKYDFVISESIYEKISQHFTRTCICKEHGEKTIEYFMKENSLKDLIRKKTESKGSKKYYFGSSKDFEEDFPKINKNIEITENIDKCLTDANIVYGRDSIGLLTLAFAGIPIKLFKKNSDNSFQMIFPYINLY
jgi:hypothetical protein